ncbi:MAG: hypothetical protein JST92_23910 [Deltaproteobacteria bacterium]|nr:hypothetical protein [Deltaproteobacteria bacterium]
MDIQNRLITSRGARTHTRRLALSLALALSAAALPSAALAGADTWEEIAKKDGITVERRPKEGAAFYELRARATVALTVEDFAATVWTFRDYTQFMPYVKVLKVLAEDAASATLYQQIAMPLVADRDYVVRWVRAPSPDGRATLLRFDSVTDVGPAANTNGFVRVLNIHGSWLLEPTDDGKSTRLTYELYSEPGGAVPSWIVNMASKDAPREVVAAMVKRVTERVAARAKAAAPVVTR